MCTRAIRVNMSQSRDLLIVAVCATILVIVPLAATDHWKDEKKEEPAPKYVQQFTCANHQGIAFQSYNVPLTLNNDLSIVDGYCSLKRADYVQQLSSESGTLYGWTSYNPTMGSILETTATADRCTNNDQCNTDFRRVSQQPLSREITTLHVRDWCKATCSCDEKCHAYQVKVDDVGNGEDGITCQMFIVHGIFDPSCPAKTPAHNPELNVPYNPDWSQMPVLYWLMQDMTPEYFTVPYVEAKSKIATMSQGQN